MTWHANARLATTLRNATQHNATRRHAPPSRVRQPASQPHVFYVTLRVTLTRVTSARSTSCQSTAADDDGSNDGSGGTGGTERQRLWNSCEESTHRAQPSATDVAVNRPISPLPPHTSLRVAPLTAYLHEAATSRASVRFKGTVRRLASSRRTSRRRQRLRLRRLWLPP